MALGRSISHLLAALFNNRAEFHRRWKQSAAMRLAPGGLEGRWEGEWISEANGHRGALKCLLTRKPEGDYEAMFHAVYAKVLTVCYTIPLRGKFDGSKLLLKGKSDLGK